MQETIVAIATATGRSGVGIIRLSGKTVPDIAKQLFGHSPTPRRAVLRHFTDADGTVIDSGVVIYFAAPHSYTGEHVLELQGHGSPIVLQLLLRRCVALGARLAEPGEFTKRAFLNQKLDLAQAESVADLIDADSEAAAKSAMRSLQGEFSALIQALLAKLIHLRMLVEACLDFPEEDIDFLQAADALGQLQQLQTQVAAVQASTKQGALLREGVQIVLIGQPNVGKSSLLNRLAGDEIAIVTEIAGTTRDTVRELIHVDGVPLHIIDTAGLRETDDVVEKIGIARTWAAIEKADIALLLLDSRLAMSAEEQLILAKLPATIRTIRVYNKIDLMPDATPLLAKNSLTECYLSAKTGQGLIDLRQNLLTLAGWQGNSEGLYLARARHVLALQQVALHLETAFACYLQVEFFAEELRLAQLALSSITGEFTADDLLGEIFSRFCIGK